MRVVVAGEKAFTPKVAGEVLIEFVFQHRLRKVTAEVAVIAE